MMRLKVPWLRLKYIRKIRLFKTPQIRPYSISVSEAANSKAEMFSKYIRIELESGGCKGFNVNFQPESKIFQNDFTQNKFVIDDITYSFIDGSTVDFVETIAKSGFELRNVPSATGSCSCNSSISFD